MATTEHFYTGNNSTTSFAFTFPYLANSDVKVELDNVVKTENTSGQTNNDYTINNTNIVFNSAPGTGVAIHIYRTTNVDTAQATFAAGSSIRAADLNNNQTQALYSAQEASGQKVRQSDLKDSIVNSAKIIDGSIATGDLADSLITTAKIANSNVTTAKIADSNVTTAKIADSNVTTAKIAADAVNGTKIADDSINSEHYVDGSIDTAHIADGQITHVKLANDAVDGDNISDDSINSEHYVDGSIDTAHIADSQVTTAKIADSNVTTAKIAADAINGTKIADDAINSEHYVDGSIGTGHIGAGQVQTANIADLNVTTGKLADSAVATAKIAADAITGAKIADDQIDSEHYVDGSIDTAHIGNSQVTTAKIAADNITNALIADDQIDSEHYVDGSIDTAHIGNTQVTDAKLASNSVITSKITDANVTTVKIADSNVTLAKLASDLKQTSISDSDTQIPTSGAVVDYVAAQIAPLGGLEVIATEVAFPNTQPASGIVISISDAGGVVFNGSGVSTTGRTVGGSTVTINGAPSSLYSETLAAGVGLMVSSTGSSQTYNYHKILGKEDDIKQLSDDINDFNARYRVGSSNPTSALDAGDLFFNTSTQKLLVYNSTNTAWEEAQSIGNFYISTFSESFDNSRTQFTVSNAPSNAQQLLISINGVIQKPNSGTGQPSEGFTLSGSTVTFSSAIPSGSDYFVVVIGSTVNIGTPSDGTITAAKITSGAVETAKIADGAVTEVKLGVSNSPTNGYFLSAQSGNTGGLTWAQVTTDLVGDTSPQLGGDLQSNGNDIDFADTDKARFGASGDLEIYHSGSESFIADEGTGGITISSGALSFKNQARDETLATMNVNSSVDLYYNNSKKFETTSNGVQVAGRYGFDANNYITCNTTANTMEFVAGGQQVGEFNSSTFTFLDSKECRFGNGNDLRIYHDGSDSYINDAGTGHLNIVASQINILNTAANESIAKFIENGQVELYYDNSKKFQTYSNGTEFFGNLKNEADGTGNGIYLGASNDLQLYHDSNTFVRNNNNAVNLIVQSDYITLRGNSTGEEYIKCVKDAQVELYHNNTKNFETGSDHVSVQGSGNNAAGVSYIKFKSGNASHRANIGKTSSSNGRLSIMNLDNDSIEFGTSGNIKLELQDAGHLIPSTNNSYDLGNSSLRWRNVYTNDLHLSNEGSSNDIDSTWGDWTIQEGESDLFLKNNRSGKKYKFNLTEVS